MKRFLLSIALATALTAYGQAPVPASATAITPGVLHKHYVLPGPNTLDVLEVDLKDHGLVLEAYKPKGLTKTTVQAGANDREDHRVIAAVNADFFSFITGWPIGNCVVNGKPVLCVPSQHSALGITTTGKPLIERFSFGGTIIAKDGTRSALQTVNGTRSAAATVLFNSFKGASTGTDTTGIECALRLVSPSWTVNDTMKFVVSGKSTAGNTFIPVNGAVISSGDSASAFIANSLAVNDTVKVFIGFAQTKAALAQVIAGIGRLVRAGTSVGSTEGVAESSVKFTAARHPRTFAGFTADSSKLMLCTVDGRSAKSIGMTFDEMGAFLVSIGVTEAFNFDGGGSTTMAVRGAIVNTPSDSTGERPVANSLQVITVDQRH